MTKILFDFEVGEIVKLTEIDRPGIVTGICVEAAGVTYRVAYWNNGERKAEWVYPEELLPQTKAE